MQIIPSIFVTSEAEFIKQINAVQNIVKQIQLDIADGEFVPAQTWAEPEIVEQNCNINVELHLMVKDAWLELNKWTAVENISRVLIHLESKNPEKALAFARDNDWQVGLVLNPETKLSDLEKYLDKIDSVMFMGVNPGRQGQKLIPEVLEKIKEFTSLNPTIFTELDGGVSLEYLPEIVRSDIKAICPGSAVFGNEKTPEENIKSMQEIINRLTSDKKQDTISK